MSTPPKLCPQCEEPSLSSADGVLQCHSCGWSEEDDEEYQRALEAYARTLHPGVPLVPSNSPPAPLAPLPTPHRPGDVFQINETHGRAGWIGAFVLATEIKSWGIQGFVHVVEKHEESGRAALVPQDEVPP
jgi:hypothetical protein